MKMRGDRFPGKKNLEEGVQQNSNMKYARGGQECKGRRSVKKEMKYMEYAGEVGSLKNETKTSKWASVNFSIRPPPQNIK